jgi:hypothetical protein
MRLTNALFTLAALLGSALGAAQTAQPQLPVIIPNRQSLQLIPKDGQFRVIQAKSHPVSIETYETRRDIADTEFAN